MTQNLQKLTEDQQKNTKTTKRKPNPKISKTTQKSTTLFISKADNFFVTATKN